MWYVKKYKDCINIWNFYDQIPRTSRTAHLYGATETLKYKYKHPFWETAFIKRNNRAINYGIIISQYMKL